MQTLDLNSLHKIQIKENKNKERGTFKSMVSPRKSCNFSIVSGFIDTTELSSLVASSTIKRLGAFFFSRIAVL